MKKNDLKILEIKSQIIKLLTNKAPSEVRILKIYERLEKVGKSTNDIDAAIDQLIDEKKIKKTDKTSSKLPANINEELKKRTSISLINYSNVQIIGDQKIGDSNVVRFLPHTTLSGEDLNEIVEAVVEHTNSIEKTIEERIKQETSKIYAQMITIFGVFVSIFAIIVISTDKMLRFSPDILDKGWLSLLGQSVALFLPVGLVIGGLVCLVIWSSRK